MASATKTPKPRLSSVYNTTFTLHPAPPSSQSRSKFSAPLLCIYTTYYSAVYLSPPLRLVPFFSPATRLYSNRSTCSLDFRGRKLIVKSVLHPELYGNEIEAYGRLRDLQGSAIPRLHGLVKWNEEETMILGIEHVEGEVLDLGVVERYGRENVEKGLIWVYGELKRLGVSHGDAQARHVLICPVWGLRYWMRLGRVLRKKRVRNLMVKKRSMWDWMKIGAWVATLAVEAHIWRWGWMPGLAILLWIVAPEVAEIVVIDFSHAEFDCQDPGRNNADARGIIEDVFRWT